MKQIFTKSLAMLMLLLLWGCSSLLAQNRAFQTNNTAYVTAPSTGPNGLTVTFQDFTFEAWIYVDSLATTDINFTAVDEFIRVAGIFGKGQYQGASGYTFGIKPYGQYVPALNLYPDPTKVSLFCHVGNPGTYEATGDSISTNGAAIPISINQWHHVACVRYMDASTAVSFKFYVDGVLSSTHIPTSGANFISANTDPLTIGKTIKNRFSVNYDLPFAGKIDEVKVWKTARTAAQVAADMSHEECPKSLPDLVAYYKLNEASGNAYQDYSTNNNPGTKNGGTQDWPLTTYTPFVQREDMTDLTLTTSAYSISGFGDCPGSISSNVVSTTDTTSGITYSWLPTTGVVNPTAMSATFNSQVSTVYTLTATKPGGCMLTLTDSTYRIAAPTFTKTVSKLTMCNGDTSKLNLYTTLQEPFYLFTVIAADGSSDIVPLNPFGGNDSMLLFPPKTRKYYIELNDNNTGCKSVKDSFTIVVNAIDSVTPSPVRLCAGVTAQLYANEAGATSYAWLPTTGLDNPNIATPTASPSATTIYTVTTSTAACPNITKTVQVIVDTLPSFTITGDTSVCPGGTLTLTLTTPQVQFNAGASITLTQPLTNGGFSNGNPYPLTIPVSGLSNELYLKEVKINIPPYTALENADIWLESPSGWQVMLLSDANILASVNTIDVTVKDGVPVPPNFSSFTDVITPCQNGGPNNNEPIGLATTLASIPHGQENGVWKIFTRHDEFFASNGITINDVTLVFGAKDTSIKSLSHPSLVFAQANPQNTYTTAVSPTTFPTDYIVEVTNVGGCSTKDTFTVKSAKPKPPITTVSFAGNPICVSSTQTITLVSDSSVLNASNMASNNWTYTGNNTYTTTQTPDSELDSTSLFIHLVSTAGCVTDSTIKYANAFPFEILKIDTSNNPPCSTNLSATLVKPSVYYGQYPAYLNSATRTVLNNADTLILVGFPNPTFDTLITNKVWLELDTITSTDIAIYLYYGTGPGNFSIIDSALITNPIIGKNFASFTNTYTIDPSSIFSSTHGLLLRTKTGQLHFPTYNSGSALFSFNPFAYTGTLLSVAPRLGTLRQGDTITNTSAYSFAWNPTAAASNSITVNTAVNTIYTLTASNGCAITSTVAVNAKLCTGTDTAVTKCISYTWYKNNTTYTTSGTYYSQIPSSSYFDTLVLTIDQPLVDDIYDTTCVTYTWPLTGQTYTAAGIYTYVDSVNCIQTNLHLAIAPKTIIITHTQTPNGTVCPGTTVSVVLNSVVSYTITPTLYYTAGATPTSFSVAPIIGYSYTLTGTDAQGCTGIHSVNIPVTSALVVNATASPAAICKGSSTTIAATGSSTALLPGAINYSITPTSTISNSTSTNNFIASPTSATTYTITGTSGGCSGTTSITVAVNTASNNATTQVACDSFAWNGTTYFTSGKYLYNYTNSNGCASVDTLHLTINASTTINTATATPSTICAGDSSILNAIVPPATNVTVSTFAGNNSGFADGTGTAAKFSYPGGVAIDALGNIYVAESDYSIIRKITPAGLVTTIAGDTTGVAGDTDGPAFTATFNYPTDVAIDASNNIYVCDGPNNKIRKITPAGIVSTLAGSGTAGNADGPGATASFSGAYGIALDASGNLYVADQYNHSIRKITPAGVVSTFAGGTQGYLDGSGTVAQFSFPGNVAVDAADNIFVADAGNRRIRKITPAGVVSTFAGSGVQGIANGPATVAQFVTPNGLFVDATGNVFVTDRDVDQIRKITPAGMVSTYAGIGTQGNTNGAASLAQFNSPNDIVVDASGNVFVADADNYRIRKITEVVSPQTITWSPSAIALNANMDSLKVFPTATTVYTVSVTNAAGCTATKTVTVTVNANSNSSTTQTACDSFAWNGTTYTASGTYTNSTTNSCGTIVDTLILTINNATYNATTVTADNLYTWNNTTYTTSGTYTHSYTNANGCASVDTLYLTIDTNVTVNMLNDTAFCAGATPYIQCAPGSAIVYADRDVISGGNGTAAYTARTLGAGFTTSSFIDPQVVNVGNVNMASSSITFNQAVAANKYYQFTFTPNASLPANSALSYLYYYSSPSYGQVKIAMAISNDGFANTNTVLFQDLDINQINGDVFNPISNAMPIVSGTTYTVRVYVYNTTTGTFAKVDNAGLLVCKRNGAFSSSSTGGTITFDWTNDNTATGIPASGTGHMPSFTATNNTGTTQVSNIVVTPTLTNGSTIITGTPDTFQVTVNPKPTVAASSTLTAVCDEVLLQGSGAVTYKWNGIPTATGDTLLSPATGGIYVVTGTDANGCTNSQSIFVMPNPNIANLSLATANNVLSNSGAQSIVQTQADGTTLSYFDANCNLIATVNDGSGGNVLGNTTSEVFVDTTVLTHNSQPYTRRHFDITPTNQGAATITIYQTQNDFDDFNTTVASTNWPPLPTGPSDASGIANLRVTQVHGTGGLGNGTPELITPTSVTWDATNNYWSITFPVDSFSSFFVHTGIVAPLAISGLTLTGKIVNNADQLTWTTMAEKENSYFELLYSTDEVNYTSIYSTPTKADNGNSNGLLDYQYTNANPSSGNNYYKVVAIAKDGRKQASQVVQLSHFNSDITIYPNPVLDKLTVAYYSEKASKIMLNLFDATGRMITSQELKVNIGANDIPVDMTAIATGNYQLQVINTSGTIHTFKVSKQ
jgi:hypothetical protein